MKRIRMHTMLATSHSWAITMRSLAESFLNDGWEVDLRSSNGLEDIPPHLSRLLSKSSRPADIDICYTIPTNFKRRFNKDSRIKAAIYNYETNLMPKEWIAESKRVDLVLPSSNFCRDIFVSNGWPAEKCIVVPLGINPGMFLDGRICNLNTDKSFRFLNISIPHYRKNIDILVDAYYSAFSGNDDVCLVLKTSFGKPKFKFECDVKNEILKIQKKHKGGNLPQIEIVTKRFGSMVPLYNACQSLVSATSSEGFGLPLLEGMAAGNIVIAPNNTGQSDFMNNDNSISVEFSQIKAGNKYQYWRPQGGAETFLPKVDSLSEKMLHVYKNYEAERERLGPGMSITANKFTWDNSMSKISSIL